MSASAGLHIYLLLLTAAAAGGGLDPLDAAIRRFDEGYRTWDLDRMKESEALLEPLCSTIADSYDAQYWLGAVRFHILLHRLGDSKNPPRKKEKVKLIEEAVRPLERAVALKQNDSEAHALLGTLLGMQIAAEPTSALWRGRAVLEHRRLAVENNPENPRALYLLGSAYFHMPSLLGRSDRGLAYFLQAKDLFEKERAAERPPRAPNWGYGSCLTFIGRIHAAAGRTEEARAGFQQALEVNPQDKLAKECLKKLNGAKPDDDKR